MDREILLDEEAQKLFEQLGGIDRQRGSDQPDRPEDLAGALLEEEDRRDEWRMLLVEFVYLISGYLTGVRLSGETPKQREGLESLLAVVDKLSRSPGHDGEILVRYRGAAFDRGQGEGGGYVVSLGLHTVDFPGSKAMANRRGVIFSHVPGRLSAAFSAMASLEIHTLHLNIRNWSDSRARLKQSLEILGRYFMALTGHNLEKNNSSFPRVFYNENDQPDPNLTLVAGLNSLSRKTMTELVAKMKGMMSNPGLEQFTSVYGALFAFKQIREKLLKPPLEINNLRWLIASKDDELLSREKSFIVRVIIDRYGSSLPATAQVVQGIYGSDYHDIEADTLEERLKLVGDFLEVVDKGEHGAAIEKEVLQNMERRLDDIPEKLFDSLIIRGNTLERRTRQGETICSMLNSKIVELLSYFKRRTGTKKKMKEMVRRPIDFDEQDYETIARDFKTTVEDVKTLLGLLKGCFDRECRFLRGAFEKNIPDFAGHEKVFSFLWHYLKEIGSRSDRVAYLNSLQALVSYMANPYESILFLLQDLLRSPEDMEYSDRNTLVLANAFLQKSPGEHYYDSEMTPEEVLLSDDRLNRELTLRIAGHLEKEQDRLFQKIMTIHALMLASLSSEKSTGSPMSFRFLFTLEREMYIFLSLVGGGASHMVVRSAVKEYGEAGSEIYGLAESAHNAKELMLLLQVGVRGLARFKDENDLPLLDRIIAQEPLFAEFADNSRAEGGVKRLTGWVASARKQIMEAAMIEAA